jgi:hypothetical protein
MYRGSCSYSWPVKNYCPSEIMYTNMTTFSLCSNGSEIFLQFSKWLALSEQRQTELLAPECKKFAVTCIVFVFRCCMTVIGEVAVKHIQSDKKCGHPHPISPQVDTQTEETIKEVAITNTNFHIACTWLPCQHIFTPNHCKAWSRPPHSTFDIYWTYCNVLLSPIICLQPDDGQLSNGRNI